MQRAMPDVLYFEHSPENPPTMTVRPGEWFEVQTQMNLGPWVDDLPEERRDYYTKRITGGNPSSGAIYIEGAEPGQVASVRIGPIDVHGTGYTRYRGSTAAMPGWLGHSNIGPQHRLVKIERGRIIWDDRLSLPVEPMLGTLGVAPKVERRTNSWAGEWGGNFDVQEITTGATVHFAVNAPGALLHVGDMHARQGDGEICGGGGIETGGVARLMVELRDKPESMTWPRIENGTHIMTVGQARPAEDAFRIALSEMILWLEEDYGMSRGEAFMFLAQVLEARVTQFVNPTFSYICKVKKEYLAGR